MPVLGSVAILGLDPDCVAWPYLGDLYDPLSDAEVGTDAVDLGPGPEQHVSEGP